MPPEEDIYQSMSVPTDQGDEWDGPWGSISPVPHSIETLCVQIEKDAGKLRIYYYPYRTISTWNWNGDVPETLEVQVGSVQLMITGAGLRRLAEALNSGQLRVVQCRPPLDWGGDICIRSIVIADIRDE